METDRMEARDAVLAATVPMSQPATSPKPIPSFAPRAPASATAGSTAAMGVQHAAAGPSSNGQAGQPTGSAAPAATAADLASASAPGKRIVECVPTQYKGIVLRKSDEKYLALLQLPGPDQKQDGAWFTVGEFDRAHDAILNQDCVALGLYGSRCKTIKAGNTYTVDDVVRAMLKARDHANNSQLIKPLMIVNCVSQAVDGKASTAEPAFGKAQAALKTFVADLLRQRKGGPTPAAGPATAAAQPAPLQPSGSAAAASQSTVAPARVQTPPPVANLSSAAAAGTSPATALAAGGQAQMPDLPQCVPTQYKGIVLRQSDNKYLALLQLPGTEGKQDGQWVTLGEFNQAKGAIHAQDCAALGIHGSSSKTIKPAKTYSIDEVVKVLLQARDYGNNARLMAPMLVINCIQTALAGKASTSDVAFASAQEQLKVFVNDLISKGRRGSLPTALPALPTATGPTNAAATATAAAAATVLTSATVVQPPTLTPAGATLVTAAAGAPPATAATPLPATAAAAAPVAITVQSTTSAGPGRGLTAAAPASTVAPSGSQGPVAAAPAATSAAAAATAARGRTPPPSGNSIAPADPARGRTPPPSGGTAAPAAAPSAAALAALAAAQLETPTAAAAWQRIQAQFSLPVTGTARPLAVKSSDATQSATAKASGSTQPSTAAGASGPSTQAAGTLPAAASGAAPAADTAAKPPADLLRVLSGLIQAQQADASKGAPGGAAKTSGPAQPNAAPPGLTQLQALAAHLMAQQGSGTPLPNPALQKVLMALAGTQQKSASPPPVPPPPISINDLLLPPEASRQGTGVLKPTGVRLVEKGPQAGKWEAKHKFFGPKGGFFQLTLGYYKNMEEAQSVHDCAALAVPESFLYRPANTYTLSQVLSLVRSVTSQPAYTNPDKIAREAQIQALKSKVRSTLTPAPLIPPQQPPLPVAPIPPHIFTNNNSNAFRDGMFYPNKEGGLERVMVIMRVLFANHKHERVHVSLVLLNGNKTTPAGLASTAPTATPVTITAAAKPVEHVPPKSSTRPPAKYRAAPRQSPDQVDPAAQGPEQDALRTAITLASAYNGVHASIEGSSIRYTAKIPINQSTWAVSVHTSPLDAACAHDAAAIGIYGKEALPFLNTPANSFTRAQVEEAMESLATKFAWVRKKHMGYVLDCIAECGIAIRPPSARQAAAQAPAAGGRKRKAVDSGGSSSQGLSPANSQPLLGGSPAPLPLDPNNAKQPPKDSALAKATTYIGVWRETSGPMKGTYSAKQSGPTGQKVSMNIYLLVGYYATDVEAARARDMVAIAFQPQPRLNFPNDTSYTREQVLELAETLIENNTKVLAKDIRQLVQLHVSRWEARMHAAMGRPPGVPRVQLSLTLHDHIEVHLSPVAGAEASESGAVSLWLAVVPRVAACIQLSMPTMPALGPTPPVSRAASPAPQLPASNNRLALTQALAAKPVAAPRQKQRKQRRPLDPLHDPDDDPMQESPSAGRGSPEGDPMSDVEDHHSPPVDAAIAAEQAAIEKENEEHRRALKRQKGVTPSALGPDDDWIGVTTEAGRPVMYSAKMMVTTKDGKSAYLQVGRCEEEEMAARLRDLAAVSIGVSARPKLNFDADEFTLSEVELLVRTLVEDYPNQLSLNQLKLALKTAENHGVRNDLNTTSTPPRRGAGRLVKASSGAMDSQAGLGSGAGTALHQQLGWPASQPQGNAMEVDLPLAQQRASSGTLGQAPSASGVGSKRERSPGPVSEVPPRVVRQDYVTARVAVVPTIRLHLMVNPSPASHRPPLRVCLEVASGVSLRLSVGPRSSRARLSAAREGSTHDALLPSSHDESEETRNKRQRLETGWGSDHLLMLASAAADADGLELDEWDGVDGTWASPSQGHKREREEYEGYADYLSSQGLGPGALSNPTANYHDLVGMVERVMTQWHRENESVVRDAIHNMAQRLPGLLVPTGLPARYTPAIAAAPAARTRAPVGGRRSGTIIAAAPVAAANGTQLHPHHRNVLQEVRGSQATTPEVKPLTAASRKRSFGDIQPERHALPSPNVDHSASDDDDDVPLQRLLPANKVAARPAPPSGQRQLVPQVPARQRASLGTGKEDPAGMPNRKPEARDPSPQVRAQDGPATQAQRPLPLPVARTPPTAVAGRVGLPSTRPQHQAPVTTMVRRGGTLPGSGPTGPPRRGKGRATVAGRTNSGGGRGGRVSSPVVDLVSEEEEEEESEEERGKVANKGYSHALQLLMQQRQAAQAPPQRAQANTAANTQAGTPRVHTSLQPAAQRPSAEAVRTTPVAKATQAQTVSRTVFSTVKDMAAATVGQGQAQVPQQHPHQRDVAMYQRMVHQQQQQQQQVMARSGQVQGQQQQQQQRAVATAAQVQQHRPQQQQQHRPQGVAAAQPNVPRAAPTATMGQHMGMVWTPQGVMQMMPFSMVPQMGASYVPANAGMQQAGVRMVPQGMQQAQAGVRMAHAMPGTAVPVQVRPGPKVQRMEHATDVTNNMRPPQR